MGIKFFYHTGVSHGNFAGWYATFNPSGDVERGVYCDGAVQCRQPEKGGSPASNRNPDADKLIGNYELLEKMTWMEPWLTQNPERWTHRRPIIESILPSLCNVSKKNSECRIWEIGHVAGFDSLATAENALKVAQAIPGASLLTYQHLRHAAPMNVLK